MNEEEYTQFRLAEESKLWKKLLHVQAPYRWNLRRLTPGYTLDIGCGIGRNLAHLEGNGLGIDTNQSSIEIARKRGFIAMTVNEFDLSLEKGEFVAKFDSLLLSHVLEHMLTHNAVSLVKKYIPTLKKSGQIILITPQERGFQSDPTHVNYFGFESASALALELNLKVVRQFSFPFPQAVGKVFIYNEHISLMRF